MILATVDSVPYRYEVLGLVSTVENIAEGKPALPFSNAAHERKIHEGFLRACAQLEQQALEASGHAVIGVQVNFQLGYLLVTGTAIRFLDK